METTLDTLIKATMSNYPSRRSPYISLIRTDSATKISTSGTEEDITLMLRAFCNYEKNALCALAAVTSLAVLNAGFADISEEDEVREAAKLISKYVNIK